MENFNKWKKLNSDRIKCEQFPAKWDKIIRDGGKDKKYLTFGCGHSGINLCLGAYAGDYGSSSVYQQLPISDEIKDILIGVLNENFPEIWKQVIHKLKSREQSLHTSVKNELENILIEMKDEV